MRDDKTQGTIARDPETLWSQPPVAMFDTLEYCEDLKKAGLTDAVANAIARGQHRFAEKQLVSRRHLDAAVSHFDTAIDNLDVKIVRLTQKST